MYVLLKMSKVENDPIKEIKNIKDSYTLIQDNQVQRNTDNIKEVFTKTYNFNSDIENFSNLYDKFINSIIYDWKKLSNQSDYYYERYGLCKLTQDENQLFGLISLNMLYKFENFTKSTDLVDKFKGIVNDIEALNKKVLDINSEMVTN